MTTRTAMAFSSVSVMANGLAFRSYDLHEDYSPGVLKPFRRAISTGD